MAASESALCYIGVQEGPAIASGNLGKVGKEDFMGGISKAIASAAVVLLSVSTSNPGWAAQTPREARPPARLVVPEPVAPSIGPEVCTPFDPRQISIGQRSDGSWGLGAPVTNRAESSINLGIVSTQAFANRAVAIIKFYGWTQQCDVGNPSTGAIIYWK
jgi:hypothetical protein